jgi:hypothetical protein
MELTTIIVKETDATDYSQAEKLQLILNASIESSDLPKRFPFQAKNVKSLSLTFEDYATVHLNPILKYNSILNVCANIPNLTEVGLDIDGSWFVTETPITLLMSSISNIKRLTSLTITFKRRLLEKSDAVILQSSLAQLPSLIAINFIIEDCYYNVSALNGIEVLLTTFATVIQLRSVGFKYAKKICIDGL